VDAESVFLNRSESGYGERLSLGADPHQRIE
jgi:hypothetical protein